MVRIRESYLQGQVDPPDRSCYGFESVQRRVKDVAVIVPCQSDLNATQPEAPDRVHVHSDGVS